MDIKELKGLRINTELVEILEGDPQDGPDKVTRMGRPQVYKDVILDDTTLKVLEPIVAGDEPIAFDKYPEGAKAFVQQLGFQLLVALVTRWHMNLIDQREKAKAKAAAPPKVPVIMMAFLLAAFMGMAGCGQSPTVPDAKWPTVIGIQAGAVGTITLSYTLDGQLTVMTLPLAYTVVTVGGK